MKRLKSSSLTAAGSIMTPFRMRRTSSNATRLFGFVIASVSRLLQKDTGTHLWLFTMAGGSSVRTRGSIFRRARFTKSIPVLRFAVSRRSASTRASARPIPGWSCSTRSKSERSSTAHDVCSIATTLAVRGFPVISAISPTIWPGPSSASRNSTPDSVSLCRTATSPLTIRNAASPGPPSLTIVC
jgi:hypothetical protein